MWLTWCWLLVEAALTLWTWPESRGIEVPLRWYPYIHAHNLPPSPPTHTHTYTHTLTYTHTHTYKHTPDAGDTNDSHWLGVIILERENYHFASCLTPAWGLSKTCERHRSISRLSSCRRKAVILCVSVWACVRECVRACLCTSAHVCRMCVWYVHVYIL